jgi:hypothetical protein
MLAPRIVFIVTEFNEVEPEDEPVGELESARATWESVGPSTYFYELTVHDVEEATFSAPFVVQVHDGVVTSVTLDGAEVEYADLPVFTIDALFDQIEEWTADGTNVWVLYDALLGHPTLVMAAPEDEPVGFSIDALQPFTSASG